MKKYAIIVKLINERVFMIFFLLFAGFVRFDVDGCITSSSNAHISHARGKCSGVFFSLGYVVHMLIRVPYYAHYRVYGVRRADTQNSRGF